MAAKVANGGPRAEAFNKFEISTPNTQAILYGHLKTTWI